MARTPSVFWRDRRDCRGPVDAECRERLEIGLDAGAAPESEPAIVSARGRRVASATRGGATAAVGSASAARGGATAD